MAIGIAARQRGGYGGRGGRTGRDLSQGGGGIP